MKKSIFFFVLGLIILSFSFSWAQEKPRLGVLRFTNQTHAGWWSANMGYELQDMLTSELANTKAFQVLERKEINAVLGEQDLGASGRIDPRTKAKIGKIKGAKYLVAGTVSAFEEQTAGTGGGIGIMGFSAGGHLASTAGTHFDKGDPGAKEAIDRASCRPDFMVLVYPVIAITEALLYYDARIQSEGFDIEMMADDLVASPLPGSVAR